MKRYIFLLFPLCYALNALADDSLPVTFKFSDAGSTQRDALVSQDDIRGLLKAALSKSRTKGSYGQTSTGDRHIEWNIISAYVPQLQDLRMTSIGYQIREKQNGTSIELCGGTSLVWHASNLSKYKEALSSTASNLIAMCK